MKNINIIYLAVLTLLGLNSFNASSQEKLGNIKGIITSKVDNSKIQGATITLEHNINKLKLTSLSDNLGQFKFDKLHYGVYTLKIKHNSHQVYVNPKITINSNITQQQNITLSPILVTPIIKEEISIIEVTDDISKSISYKEYSKSYDKVSEPYGIYNKRSIDNQPNYNTESYNSISENGYKLTKVTPLSTFSADVDAASYSNVRRFLTNGQKPEKGAVRIEEMINYFNYDYPNPTNNRPFSITTEIGECPWSKNKLVHIGLQGQRIDKEELPASNLVFLLDVSGSMNSANKLPLLKKSFKMLVNQLDENDRVAIVVYAGAAGVVLEPTPGSDNQAIMNAINKLQSGGSTAGGAGIELAYKIAQENFIKNGNNRVILATDGDFNIGMSSDDAMENLIVKKRETGIFLTCLGFGTGNFKDSKMEALADKGNGNYAYIDNIFEAKKVLVTEMGATLLTIAKDVKIQVEFNSSVVQSYRLIGYENRLLNAEDFNDDTKDAGEIGAGHSVTALYEVVLVGDSNSETPSIDPLRYKNNQDKVKNLTNEILTVKFRYKKPDGDTSLLIEKNLENKTSNWESLSNNYKFSAAVAQFGMLLRESKYMKKGNFDQVLKLAKQGIGEDKNGYRAEFIRLIDAANTIYSL